MNMSFLPSKIKEALGAELAERIPVSIVRSSSTVDGEPGESYLISFEDRMLLFSRGLGESDYSLTSELFGKVAKLELEKDGMNIFMNVTLGGQDYSLKFSSFEEGNLKSVLDTWRANAGCDGSEREVVEISDAAAATPPSVVAASTRAAATGELSPLEGLAAALMFVSAVDNDISEAEDRYITTLFAHRRDVLMSALAYYKRHTFEDLVEDLKGRLTNEQKLCYLANMLELGMKDMVLHSSEQRVISHFVAEMEVSEEESTAIRQVLMIKNRISALDA